MKVKPQPVDDITLIRPMNGWVMNQELADELQQHPSHPLMYGVDGRFTGVVRRFRGFKRLDFDIRYPCSNAGRISAPLLNVGVLGAGPNHTWGSMSDVLNYGPHTWDGTINRADGVLPSRINPKTSTIYQFVGGTLDRSRRTEWAADRRPLSVFLIHFLDGNGDPVVKMMARAIGDTTLESLWQSVLIGGDASQVDLLTESICTLNLALEPTGVDVDWVGLSLLGRFILLSHKGDAGYETELAGDTFLYDVPYKAYRGPMASVPNGLPEGYTKGPPFADVVPDVDYPKTDTGYLQKGDKFTRCKLAGIRGWNWMAPNRPDTRVTVLTITQVEEPMGGFDPHFYYYSLKHNGTYTRWINYNASAAAVKTAIERLPDVSKVDVVKNEGDLDEWVVTFRSPTGVLSPFEVHEPTEEHTKIVTLIQSIAGETEIAGASEDGAVYFLDHATVAGEVNKVPHTALDQFRLRIRLVNYTTGFVSPMSDPLQLTVGAGQAGVMIQWVPGTAYDTADTMGAVQWEEQDYQVARNRKMLAALFGVEVMGDNKTRTGYADPTVVERLGLQDVRLQIWVTMSVPADNPSGGGGYYFLDQEVPVVFRRVPSEDTLFATTDSCYIWPGWLGDESMGSRFIGKAIPCKSNDELMSSEIYVPDSDDIGDLEPSPALGNLGGSLVSISDGGSALEEASVGDIKCSPPWKTYPGFWCEGTAPLFHHAVLPRGKLAPKFVNVGDVLFLVDQNKMVRLVKDGTTILADDVDISGGLHRDGVCGVGDSLVVITSSGLHDVNPVTLKTTVIAAVQRVISERWSQYVNEGRIMSGYDPQLKALFIAPKRASTSTEWFRSEALVIWLDTGRATMLADVYWCGMTRGIHPLTGKEHLFFIDPAMNITYADDSLDDTVQPATMVGISAFQDIEHPGKKRTREKKVYALSVAATEIADPNAIIFVDGIPFQIDAPNSWTDDFSAPDVEEQIAESIADAIQAWLTEYPDTFNISSVLQEGTTITIESRMTGTINDQFDLVHLKGIADDEMILTVETASETIETPEDDPETEDTDESIYLAGGAFQGTAIVTSGTVDGVGSRIISDSLVLSGTGSANFDMYAYYNPHEFSDVAETPGDATQTLPGLIGAQVYFFRMIEDAQGISRPTLVADGRIHYNSSSMFAIAETEINYHNGATWILSGDHYCISPVILQVVGAPLDSSDFPGSGIDHSCDLESLGVYLRNRKGTAKENGLRLPATNPMQGALFFGAAFPADLEGRGMGKVVSPRINVGVVDRQTKADGSAGGAIWDETTIDVVTAPINTGGNSLFPVFTCYGTDYLFDVLMVQGRVSRRGRVGGATPEGY